MLSIVVKLNKIINISKIELSLFGIKALLLQYLKGNRVQFRQNI